MKASYTLVGISAIKRSSGDGKGGDAGEKKEDTSNTSLENESRNNPKMARSEQLSVY